MARVCNQMAAQSISLAATKATTVVGNGFEGVLNGATNALITIDCGTCSQTVDVTVFIIAMFGAAPFALPTTYTVTAGTVKPIPVSDLYGYAIEVVLTNAVSATQTVKVGMVLMA